MDKQDKAVLQAAEEEIFARAIQIRPLAARSAYLDTACGTDGELRLRLERLLNEYDHPDDLFAAPDAALAAVVHDDHPAGSFGEFEIIREIGRGGMGIVYEAQQTSLNRQVALKVLSVGWGFSKQAVIRFQREAQAAARLHHTNIVPIYTTGMQNQIPYYAMELVRGPSLNQVLKQLRNDSSSTDPSESNSGLSGSQEKSTPAEAGLEAVDGASRSPGTGNDSASRASTVVECHTESLQSSFGLGSGADYFDKIARFVAEVADALEHAHREGVIHRDIKPSNLLLSPDGRVSINDFGLAQMLDHPGVTITGELMGSPRYMSPEQISPDLGPLDHRTDIYSLGVTLYELITLRPAFDGHQRAQLLAQVIHREPKAPRRLNPQIPVDLETICLKAMEKAPEQRYQRAATLANDLRRFVDRHTITAKPIGALGRTVRWCRRNRALAALSTMLAITILASATLLARQHMLRARAAETRFQIAIHDIQNMLRLDHPWDATMRIQTARRDFPERQQELNELFNTLGREVTIVSDRPGAQVLVRPAYDKTGSWLALGKTPITTRLPLEDYHVELKIDGREDVITTHSTYDANDDWRLLSPRQKGMVRIPQAWHVEGSDECRITWLFRRQLPRIKEFQIDRHEVNNAEFKRFVDDGAYEKPENWQGLLGRSWRETVDQFRDSTEEFGPRFWVDGTYPPGLEAHPVVGVSWYEAMAYAKWSGKRLPTLFHWLRGADFNGWYAGPDVAMRDNIGDRGEGAARAATDAALSVCKYGVFDTSGNVKEWCLNEDHDGMFYAMGGSWRDADGSTFDPVSFAALERRDDVGFRCAVYQERADLMGPTPVHWRSIPREKPEIDPYRQRFEYDRSTAWNNSVPQWIQFNGMRAQKIAFDAVYGNGERITCYILFPDRARYAPPYPVVIGSSRIVRGDEGTPRLQGDLMAYYQAILRGGRAVVLPTLFSHSFDRRSVEFPSMYPDPNDLDGYARRVVKMANDVSRTADFIEDYASLFGDDSLDSQNLAFVRCANLNTACWLVADKFFVNGGSSRFKAVIFPNDGIENCTLPPEVDQLTYLPWLDTPALMINSKRDLWHPYELSQTRMYDLLPLSARAKRHVAIPNYAWGLPLEDWDREVNQWLDSWLGKPRLAGTP